jgi:hypothetical protein
MKLKESLEAKLMDVRLRDRLIAEGKVSKKEVDQYLSQLQEEPESAYESVNSATETNNQE